MEVICTLAFLIPQINIIPNNQSLPIPLVTYTRPKRAVLIILLLIAMGITAGISAGIGDSSSSVYIYQKLSTEFNDDIVWVSQWPYKTR
jgi:hypothetical protein